MSFSAPASRTGRACAGSLLLRVTPVEHISLEESDDHKAGRPAETWPERVVAGEVDEHRESAYRGEHEDDQDSADRAVPRDEELYLELPPRAVSFMNVASPGRVGRDPFAAPHPESLAPGQALERQMLVLALADRRRLERLPERLMSIHAVGKVGEQAQHEPCHEDVRRVGDVFEQELREHRADEQRANQRQDGDAVATELDVPWHPVRPMKGGFDETQTHDGQVGRAESKRGGQRVDGAHKVDLFAARDDAG